MIEFLVKEYNLHSNDTHAATESPGQKTWSRLGVCPYVVLAVVAGQVNLNK